MIYISAVGMVNALGNSADEIAANLNAGVAPGMRHRAGWLQGLPDAMLGGVEGELPPIPDSLAAHRSRNNQLLLRRWHRFSLPLRPPSPAWAATAWR